MKLAALCCTYLRSHLLGQSLACFLDQDYPADQRELIILDDAGEYLTHSGDGWRMVSVPWRFHSLGEKRNACAALASPDVEGFLVWDDDDLYLPHAFRMAAAALAKAPLSRPGQVLYFNDEQQPTGLVRKLTGGLYHGGWAYRRGLFERIGGYRAKNNGEDRELLARIQQDGAATVDPLTLGFDPAYIYRDRTNSFHLSWSGPTGYEDLAAKQPTKVQTGLLPARPFPIAQIPVGDKVLPRPF